MPGPVPDKCNVGALLGDGPVWSHSQVLGLAEVYKSCPNKNIYIWRKIENQKLIQAKLD